MNRRETKPGKHPCESQAWNEFTMGDRLRLATLAGEPGEVIERLEGADSLHSCLISRQATMSVGGVWPYRDCPWNPGKWSSACAGHVRQ